MTNENGRRMDKAEPSSPAEILGMSDVPDAGDHFYVMDDKKARDRKDSVRNMSGRKNRAM